MTINQTLKLTQKEARQAYSFFPHPLKHMHFVDLSTKTSSILEAMYGLPQYPVQTFNDITSAIRIAYEVVRGVIVDEFNEQVLKENVAEFIFEHSNTSLGEAESQIMRDFFFEKVDMTIEGFHSICRSSQIEKKDPIDLLKRCQKSKSLFVFYDMREEQEKAEFLHTLLNISKDNLDFVLLGDLSVSNLYDLAETHSPIKNPKLENIKTHRLDDINIFQRIKNSLVESSFNFQ